MSDEEDVYEMHRDDTRYSTPVPELDDHRHQMASVQRPQRSRRGTIDTLYGAQAMNESGTDLAWVDSALARANTRDYETAIEDGDGVSPMQQHSRRPTADSRAASPPNSVKAFAAARRRERDHSVEAAEKKLGDDRSIHRTVSRNSRVSQRSRRYTNETDGISVADSIHSSAAEDVCFPQSTANFPRDKRKLYIDFDFLENFIAEEERDHTPPKNQPAPRTAFKDLRSSASISKSAIIDSESIPENKEMDDILDEKLGKPAAEHYDGNRFSFFSSAWESTIHAAEFGDLIMPGEDVRNLFYLPENEDDGVWWLNLSNPTEEEIRAICKAFQIHPLTMEDIEKQETREKIELFPAYYFACFRSFNTITSEEGNVATELDPFNVYVIVFREGTLSFSFAPNRHVGVVRKRITALKDYVALSSDWICYALIDDIVDSFAPLINQIEAETDNIEDQVFIARTDDMHDFLRTIGNVRKTVMALMKLLGGKADVLRGFTKRCNENYNVTPRMDIGLYLGDIQDHVVTMMSNLGHFEKMLSRSHSNYLAQLSIDNITQGTNSNKVLSKITMVASVLVPLNLVSGNNPSYQHFARQKPNIIQTPTTRNFPTTQHTIPQAIVPPQQTQLPTYQLPKESQDTMDASGEFDVNSLTQRDKQELQQFIQNETQKSKLQQSVHNLTDICWTKCVTGGIKSGKLDKSEETCARNCVDRFLDANFLVIKQLEGMSGR
ncbi:hypothetical protein V493_06599 [Pseudogymnoascus sp. VKM F-4281 (FW-2241)]|nr:hypothetical protein V493_06599 [Pseudogymnoascus sp. VKM F-4281 (FW-2241)]